MYRLSFDDKQKEIEELKACITQTLKVVGEDTQREGLLNTPERVAKCILTFTSGYEQDPVEVLRSAKFQESYAQPVIVKGVEFYSLCEHHMLPFFGKVHVAYIPDGSIVGLSKIPRAIDILSHRLQVQERFTRELCQCIQEALHPRGVMVADARRRETRGSHCHHILHRCLRGRKHARRVLSVSSEITYNP